MISRECLTCVECSYKLPISIYHIPNYQSIELLCDLFHVQYIPYQSIELLRDLFHVQYIPVSLYCMLGQNHSLNSHHSNAD